MKLFRAVIGGILIIAFNFTTEPSIVNLSAGQFADSLNQRELITSYSSNKKCVLIIKICEPNKKDCINY